MGMNLDPEQIFNKRIHFIGVLTNTSATLQLEIKNHENIGSQQAHIINWAPLLL